MRYEMKIKVTYFNRAFISHLKATEGEHILVYETLIGTISQKSVKCQNLKKDTHTC